MSLYNRLAAVSFSTVLVFSLGGGGGVVCVAYVKSEELGVIINETSQLHLTFNPTHVSVSRCDNPFYQDDTIQRGPSVVIVCNTSARLGNKVVVINRSQCFKCHWEKPPFPNLPNSSL